MASLDSIASLMADDGRAKPRRASRDLYATVRLQQDGSISVVVDGSSSEAPATAMVGVHHGDRVMCHIVDHSIVIFANVTAPTTDDSTALVAIDRADVAREAADAAGTAAAAAQDSADDAADAATAAQSSADQAGASARQAIADAAAANVAALSAQSSADQASQAAAVADGKAVAAGQAASSAQASATRANTAANDAFTQLSIVEDVSGTLSWIRDHGTYVATTDTSVQDGTVYFELVSGDYVLIAQPDPEANPRTEGWYVLDITDSQTDYIMAHLAVTSAGLWVLPSGLGDAASEQYAAGYKALLAPDGMYVFDGSGHLVATYGESITLDSSRPQYIGGEDAYILYYDSDEDGSPDSIVIGGSNVRFDGVPLSEMLGASDALHYDHEFIVATDPVTGVTTYTFTAHLFRGATEVTDQVDPEFFCWWLRTEAGDTFLGHGRTMAVDASRAGYNGSVIGGVDDVLHFALIDDEDDEMQDDEADTIVGEWLLSEAAGRD